jgi:Zn-dependent protease with chaperone function
VSGIAASFFDGRRPQRHVAELTVDGDEIVVRGSFGERRAGRSQVEISEPMGRSPRLLRFADGAVCEIADHAAFAVWLDAAGFAESAVVRLQSRWSLAVAALLAAILAVLAAYFWGLPAASKMLAPRIPDNIVQAISTHTLSFLDERVLKPSRLPEARQAALREHAAAVLQALPAHSPYHLHFRASPMGPNAFALPNGDLVIFDELVALATSDDEISGVVAHELGHVVHHHGMRQMIQSSVVAFVAGIYLGDISSIVSGLAVLAMESRYSRAFEFEADAYAAQVMVAAGRGREPLASMLEKLEEKMGGKGGTGWDGLSSHPDTAERVRRLRGGNSASH